ncbi:MAG TPA: DUF1853 family protein [Flavobacteriaceae bacterium]|nr:DUF1853 family protein [Flavobacteriaceae bacterium]
MAGKIDNYQDKFSGFFRTPHLFNSKILGLNPFSKTLKHQFIFNRVITANLRLGQLVEQFVFEELKQFESIKILSENLQIINEDKLTIGELDTLILDKQKPIHIEIQYKFYLFDKTIGQTEIEHCIGPNRKDTLIQKLKKLKEKQLPLLYHKTSKTHLEQLNLNTKNIDQQIYFKAQIFMPYGENIQLKTLNNDCIYGFYFNFKKLKTFKDSKFFIPKKLDWLVDIHTNVNWQNYEQIQPQLEIFYSEKYAPMLWLKSTNGEIKKCFMVWW